MGVVLWYDNFTKIGFSICFGFIQIYTHHSHLFGTTCFSLYSPYIQSSLWLRLTIFKASNTTLMFAYVDIFYLELLNIFIFFCIEIFSDVISQNVHGKFEHVAKAIIYNHIEGHELPIRWTYQTCVLKQKTFVTALLGNLCNYRGLRLFILTLLILQVQ